MNGYRVRIDAFLPSSGSIEDMALCLETLRKVTPLLTDAGFTVDELRQTPVQRRTGRPDASRPAPGGEAALNEALAAIKQAVGAETKPDVPEMPEHLRRTRQTAAE